MQKSPSVSQMYLILFLTNQSDDENIDTSLDEFTGWCGKNEPFSNLDVSI